MKSKQVTKTLSDFQRELLNKANVDWLVYSDGKVELSMDDLTADQFVELLGAGCFTYHLEPVNAAPEEKHRLAFSVALRYADKFVQKEDIPLNHKQVLRTTIVQERKVGNLDVLVYPITVDGVDRGLYKVAWGGA